MQHAAVVVFSSFSNILQLIVFFIISYRFSFLQEFAVDYLIE